jgi:iron-sulfur cluster repair protein YtfE (RIC family)
MPVFNRFGLDTCCGAMLSVEEAARQEGVDREALCAELHAAALAR